MREKKHKKRCDNLKKRLEIKKINLSGNKGIMYTSNILVVLFEDEFQSYPSTYTNNEINKYLCIYNFRFIKRAQ